MTNPVKDYWYDHYSTPDAGGYECTLCGNTGWVDTTETAVTRDGRKVGRRQPCICPNGQALRDHLAGKDT